MTPSSLPSSTSVFEQEGTEGMTRTSAADHLLLGENQITEAILPASDTGRAVSHSLPVDWRQLVGGLLLVAGVIAIVAAWLGVSGTGTLGDQLSYIASGGLGGAGLIAVGVMFVVMREHAADRASLAELTAHMMVLEEGMTRLLADGRRK